MVCRGIEYHKSQATAKAMAESKADLIIESVYEVTSSGSNVSIITTGYACNYENFRQLNGADTTLLVDAGINNYNSGLGDTPAPTAVKKKNRGALALLLIVGAAAVVYGLQ